MADDGGLKRFQLRMQAIPVAVRKAVQPAILQAGEDVAASIRALAESSRDTGELIASIAVTGPGMSTPPYSQPGGSTSVPENAVAITVGNTDVRYPHLVEHGTAHAPAKPFFWPGFRLARKRAELRIKRAISKAIKDTKK